MKLSSMNEEDNPSLL